jgi:hypothetical protein
MARNTELEKEVGEALDAFLKKGGCGDHKDGEDVTEDADGNVLVCCVTAFIAGIENQNVYPDSSDDLEID